MRCLSRTSRLRFERAIGVEPTTTSLGTKDSTTELRPHVPGCPGSLLVNREIGRDGITSPTPDVATRTRKVLANPDRLLSETLSPKLCSLALGVLARCPPGLVLGLLSCFSCSLLCPTANLRLRLLLLTHGTTQRRIVVIAERAGRGLDPRLRSRDRWSSPSTPA